MELLSICHYASRGLQLLCAVVIIGLSCAWLKQVTSWLDDCKDIYEDGWCESMYSAVNNPIISALRFDVFAGAFAVIDAAVGLAGALATSIPWIMCVVGDTLCAIFLLAGGIATTVLVKKTNLNSDDACAIAGLSSFCDKVQAVGGFLIFGFVVVLVAATLLFLRRRKQSNVVRYPAIQHGVEL